MKLENLKAMRVQCKQYNGILLKKKYSLQLVNKLRLHFGKVVMENYMI